MIQLKSVIHETIFRSMLLNIDSTEQIIMYNDSVLYLSNQK